MLWKHVDAETGAQVRRMRRMVVSVHATVANYEYLIYWRFYADGNIECEVRATGLMVTTPLADDQDSLAVRHDGRRPGPTRRSTSTSWSPSSTSTSTARTTPSSRSTRSPRRSPPSNPYGLALTTQATTIESETRVRPRLQVGDPAGLEGAEPHQEEPARHQHGVQAGPRGRDPGAAGPVLTGLPARTGDRPHPVGDRARRRERWPAGDYPTQSERSTPQRAGRPGHPRWIDDDAPLVDTDVVLWYVFGIHHITRVEDWPIMPVDTISFWLKPFGFFDANPSLDAPQQHRRPLPPGLRPSIDDGHRPRGTAMPDVRQADLRPTSSTARSAPGRLRRRARHRQPVDRRGLRDVAQLGRGDVDAACQAAGRPSRSTAGPPRRAAARPAEAGRRDRGERRRAGRGSSARTPASRSADHVARRSPRWSTRSGSSPARPGCWKASRAVST